MLAALETRPCLGVKADDGRVAQGRNGPFYLFGVVDDVDATGEGDHGHLIHGLFVY
jgi:hypothetical protein